jgi:predicted TIM-barrel fold metal-dependent hydrolase
MATAPEGFAILDSHCHAWRRWPYEPAVPDETSRGTIEQLLHELDAHGVEQALVVCASIDHNPDNVEYVAAARDRHPTRLQLVADLDCSWSATYHAPGAAERLRLLDDRYGLRGVTHYLAEENDGWLASGEADAVFALAAERGLIVSLGASPVWQADLRTLAARHPSVPVLCHALGVVRAGEGLADVLASAEVANIYIKVAGLPYCAERDWDYPWPDVLAVLEQISDAYGAARLCWGSDFPASTRYCTFRQSLEVVRTHCTFFSPDELRLVLGETLRSLLAA